MRPSTTAVTRLFAAGLASLIALAAGAANAQEAVALVIGRVN
jgi:hypothetical protein